jgi:CBS domain-containing protein
VSRFAQIKAREIMQADLVVLTPSTPIESAIQTLEELEIGGAPVVDESGRPVGILSKSDVSRVEHVRSGRIVGNREDWALADLAGEVDDDATEDLILDKEDYSSALRSSDTVEDWMNPKVVAVRPESSLKEVCRTKVREHIHRVLVASDGKIQGIITSFDVVRYVADER